MNSFGGGNDRLFYAFLAIAIVICVSDLIFLKVDYTQAIFYTYLFNISISLLTFIGILFFQLSIRRGNILIVYSLFHSILINELLKPQNEYFEGLFVRDIIFGLIIMVIGALFIGRKHIIFFCCSLSVTYISKALITNNPFLWNNSYNIIISFITFSLILYILIQELEKNYALKEKYIKELNHANQTKDLFFSVLAHDLRNPFQSLMGLNEIVKDHVQKGNIGKAELHLSKMEDTTHKTFQLLDNLLIWSYSESGKIQFNPTIIDFKKIISENIKFFDQNIKSKNIRINLKLHKQETLFADKNMLSAVIRNLLSNAIKFSPLNEEIILSSSYSNNSFIFSISDNGQGIAKKHIPTLFNLANKYTSKGTQNETGTGFGLAICKDFISKHKGEIWLDSEPSKGTTFTFSIPADTITNTLDKI